MKKFISALTALAITCTLMLGAVPISAEDTQTVQPEIENNVTVKGENSFGDLLSDMLSEEIEEQEQNNGCNIFSAEVTGNAVSIEFETAENCTLLAAVYDEAGEQMLASGYEEVIKGETEKTVTIETDSMPEYFYLKAFLVDTNTLRPICTVYESPNYTKEMQEFFAKTVDDFDSEKVLNLDNDKSNNFAVYGEGTKIIESDGVVNKVTKSDEENGIYVIENADSSVTALAKDDIFALVQPDGNVLIAKIGDIKVSGKTVTITEQETSMEEVFDYVKIDESKGMENATVDNSNLEEGVVYNGIVENEGKPESRTYSQENKYNSDEAYLPAAPEYQAVELDKEQSIAVSYSFVDKKLVGGDNNNVTLSGGVNFEAKGSVKLYVSLSYAYLEAKLDMSVKLNIALTAKASVSVPLGLIGISPAPGVFIEFTPSIVIEIEGKIELSGTLKSTLGIRVSSDEGITDLSSTPSFETTLKAEVKGFVGLSLKPEVKVLSDKIAKAGMEAKLGAEITASTNIYQNPSSRAKHECNMCIAGDLSIKAELKAEAKLADNDKWGFSVTLFEYKLKLFDFYYSIDRNEFGIGKCPHDMYKVSVWVKDEDGKHVSDAEIKASCSTSSTNINGKTSTLGRFETWFPSGYWTITVSKDNQKVNKDLLVTYSRSTTITLNLNSDSDSDNSSSGNGLWSGRWGGSFGGSSLIRPIRINGSNRPNVSADSQRLSLGHLHSGYIDDNDNLYMWGYNKSGEIGNGTTTNSSIPIKIMNNIKSVSLGFNHSAAITNDGILYMWGANSWGQLGNGTTTDSLTPIKIMDNVKAVSLGVVYSAAITNDGSLYTWGFNCYGQLGNGTIKDSLTPIKIMDNVRSVSLGESHSAAITNDGTLYMWGNNEYGKLGDGTTEHSSIPIKIMDNVKTVELGYWASGVITNNGSFYMWGFNNANLFGDVTIEYSLTPIKIMNNVKSICIDYSTSGAITNDGSLYLWGDNILGQLGNGTIKSSSKPIKIMDNVKSVGLGDGYSGAITNDGSLYMWGNNYYGQSGNGTTKNSSTPIKITMPSASAKTIPSTLYLADEPTESALQTAEFTGLLPNETYNFYSVLNNELLYVSQGISDEKGNLNVSYIPKKDDTDADIFLKGMTRTDISGAEVTVPDILCNGKEQFAQSVVTIDGVTLADVDYDIELEYSAVYPGEYDITIVGVGDYTGEIKAVYNVYCEHSFGSGKCTICKSLETLKGDVNGDSATGVADIVALQKYLTKKKLTIKGNGDINSDGAINVFDDVALRHIILNAK